MKYKIIDMAMSKNEAIDKCMELGEKFIEHFHKIYKNPNDVNVNYWAGEMQGWLNTVRKIKLKITKDYLNDGHLWDWFYTACSDPESVVREITPEEAKVYYRVVEKCLISNNVRNSIKEVIKK